MLQVDPKRRITVTQLLSHPWLMDGYEGPVKWQSKYHTSDLDPTVIETMAAYKLMSPAQVSHRMLVQKNSTNSISYVFLRMKCLIETENAFPQKNF